MKLKKLLGKNSTIKVALILLILVPAALFFPTWTPSIKGYPNSTSVLEQAEINGAEHGIMIRGNDINNPILIFVHGGPGAPEMPYVRKYQDILEKHFTVVHYDQRGAGKSFRFFEDYSELSVELLIEDLLELTDYIKDKLQQEEVLLVGHSFGTTVGIKAVHKAPEKYLAYIGVG
jgi:L-proline amide hydrolase